LFRIVRSAQAPAHVTGRNTNNRIVAGVIGNGPPKKLHSNEAFFQRIEAASDRLVDDELKELNAPGACLKYIPFEYFLQMLMQGRSIGFGLCDL
jgi:hypothetical protein